MVANRLPGGGSWFAALGAILLLSTGVAGSTIIEGDGLVGHTAYVQAVVAMPGEPSGPENPLQYGLATLREVSLFGLWSRDRPLEEPDDWLVYTWAQNAPDPRDNPTLNPTGDHAVVTDRTGKTWIVHELTYQSPTQAPARPEFGLDEPPTFHTYVVAPAETRTLHDGTRYNHVLTYRPERLIGDLQQLEPQAAARHDDATLRDSDRKGSDTFYSQGVLPAQETQRHPVVSALGPVPHSLERFL